MVQVFEAPNPTFSVILFDYSYPPPSPSLNISDKVASEMETLVRDHGVNSFKTFMAYKGVFQVDDSEMYQGA